MTKSALRYAFPRNVSIFSFPSLRPLWFSHFIFFQPNYNPMWVCNTPGSAFNSALGPS